MAQNGPPPGAIMECLWDKDGKYAIKEDDWECPSCSSYNDNMETVNGKKEQLYKCATCTETRPGFATIRRQKEAEASKADPDAGLTGFQISFGGDAVVAGSSPKIDIFGGGSDSGGSGKKGSSAKGGAAGGLDLFGGGGSKEAAAPALNLFGSPTASAAPAANVFGTASPSSSSSSSAAAPTLDLFGAGAVTAPAPAGGASAADGGLNVGALLQFAASDKGTPAVGKGGSQASKKRKAGGGGTAKKSRVEPDSPVAAAADAAAAADTAAAPAADVQYVHPSARPPANGGRLFSWGSGECDQLGHGKVEEDEEGFMDTEERRPRQVAQVKDHDFRFISCGGLHTAALDKDGRIFTWGCNDDKALGRTFDNKQALLDFYKKADAAKTEEAILKIYNKYDGAGRVEDLFTKLGAKYGFFPDCESVPGPVTSIEEPCVQVECGDCHTVALTASGRVFTWGCYKDANGQLGFDSEGTDTQVLPREVPDLFKTYGKVVQVASGGNHTLALTAKGVVIAWGDAEQGQVARKVPSRHKAQGLRLHPVSFPRGTVVAAIFANGFSSFALKENGEGFAWGLNNYGQLATGDHETQFSTAALAIPGEQIVQVSGGIHHTIFLTRSGRVFGAGKCQSGQLGGPQDKFVKSGIVEPTLITALLAHTVVEIASGSNFNLCRTAGGKVFAWGSNQMSQLGLDVGADVDEVYIPKEVPLARFEGGAAVVQLDAGAQHSAAIVRPK